MLLAGNCAFGGEGYTKQAVFFGGLNAIENNVNHRVDYFVADNMFIVFFCLAGFKIVPEDFAALVFVTTMNIGYFSVRQDSGEGFIDWTWLRGQPCLEKKKFFNHTRIDRKLGVVMDGRKAIFLIYKDIEDSKIFESHEVEIASMTSSMF